MRSLVTFVAIVAAGPSWGFSTLAADGEHGAGHTDFSAFWQRFKSAVIASDKAVVAEMTKFPLSMPYEVKAVKNKEAFLRRYSEIFKGEADAARCFKSAEPDKRIRPEVWDLLPFQGHAKRLGKRTNPLHF